MQRCPAIGPYQGHGIAQGAGLLIWRQAAGAVQGMLQPGLALACGQGPHAGQAVVVCAARLGLGECGCVAHYRQPNGVLGAVWPWHQKRQQRGPDGAGGRPRRQAEAVWRRGGATGLGRCGCRCIGWFGRGGVRAWGFRMPGAGGGLFRTGGQRGGMQGQVVGFIVHAHRVGGQVGWHAAQQAADALGQRRV